MSRPWKVLEMFGRRYSGAVSSTAWPASSQGVNSPLSGPMKVCSPDRRAIGRRLVPTPGSTTASKSEPAGK